MRPVPELQRIIDKDYASCLIVLTNLLSQNPDVQEAARSASNYSEEYLYAIQERSQRRYFEANKVKLEKQGVNVKEWEESSKGLKLPPRAPKQKSKKSL